MSLTACGGAESGAAADRPGEQRGAATRSGPQRKDPEVVSADRTENTDKRSPKQRGELRQDDDLDADRKSQSLGPKRGTRQRLPRVIQPPNRPNDVRLRSAKQPAAPKRRSREPNDQRDQREGDAGELER